MFPSQTWCHRVATCNPSNGDVEAEDRSVKASCVCTAAGQHGLQESLSQENRTKGKRRPHSASGCEMSVQTVSQCHSCHNKTLLVARSRLVVYRTESPNSRDGHCISEAALVQVASSSAAPSDGLCSLFTRVPSVVT